MTTTFTWSGSGFTNQSPCPRVAVWSKSSHRSPTKITQVPANQPLTPKPQGRGVTKPTTPRPRDLPFSPLHPRIHPISRTEPPFHHLHPRKHPISRIEHPFHHLHPRIHPISRIEERILGWGVKNVYGFGWGGVKFFYSFGRGFCT